MADHEGANIGALIEQLGARFELVVEGLTGIGGRMETIREEMLGQFVEVGKQIRFLSEQIAVNREGLASMRADLGAEIIRLGEALGQSRVETRDQFAARSAVGQEAAAISHEVSVARDAILAEGAALRKSLAHELSASAVKLKTEFAASAETTIRKMDAELKRANKALTTLGKKFDRFDDRITIQTRDQEQRVRKIERGSRG
ncbi:MAG: hypothetical protein ACREP6_11260 [Candidatus Binataceae bacterium]